MCYFLFNIVKFSICGVRGKKLNGCTLAIRYLLSRAATSRAWVAGLQDKYIMDGGVISRSLLINLLSQPARGGSSITVVSGVI